MFCYLLQTLVKTAFLILTLEKMSFASLKTIAYLCSAIEWKRCNPTWVSRLRHKILETLQKTSTFCGVSPFIAYLWHSSLYRKTFWWSGRNPLSGLHKAGCESIGSAKVGSWKRDLHRYYPIEIAEELRKIVVALPSKGIGSLSAYQRRNLAEKGSFFGFSDFSALFLKGTFYPRGRSIVAYLRFT